MLAAVQRHAHEPDEERRSRLIRRTFLRIRHEAELVAIALPQLTQDEERAVLDATVLGVLHELGYAVDDSWLDAEVDLRFERRCLAAREQKAEPRVRAKLIARRLEIRWGLVRG